MEFSRSGLWVREPAILGDLTVGAVWQVDTPLTTLFGLRTAAVL